MTCYWLLLFHKDEAMTISPVWDNNGLILTYLMCELMDVAVAKVKAMFQQTLTW